MDDFEYSVRISEQDWDSFFLECEECNLLPPVLAGMEDSGMSDMDEIASYRARRVAESSVPDPELQTSSPDHAEYPVDLYLSRYGATSPMQVLSGSEDDLHMETVNVFFERLKSVSASEDPLTQKHHASVVGKMAGHLIGSVEVRNTKEIAVNSQAIQRNESTQTDDSYTSRYNNLAVNELEVVAELFIKDKDWSLTTIKDRMKCDEVFKDTRPISDTGKTSCCALVKGKDLTGPNQENSQLVTGGSSENSKELVSQSPSSITPRRKRRKKKRMSCEPADADHGHEVQFQAKQSESDDDIFVRRQEMDRVIHPSADCSSGTVSEIGNTSHILLPPPPKIDNILESFPVYPQSLPGNVIDPTVACPDSAINRQERLKSPSTITAAQNKGTLDFMHGKSDLTGKPASAGQFSIAVSLTSTENGEPVKKAEPLILQSNDCTLAIINRDNVGSDLQLNSHLRLEINTALKGSEALPASLTTCDEVEEVLQIARKPGSTEKPLLLFREMNEDYISSSSILHHTGNAQVSSTALLPTVLLPSEPAVCSKVFNNPHDQYQVGDMVALPDTQSAVSQRKTSTSDNISCVSSPEIREKMALSACYDKAETKQNLTSVTHEEVPPAQRNGHDFVRNDSLSGTFDSKLATQSHLVKMGKAQKSLENAQMLASLSADVIKSAYSTETKTEVAVMSNECVNGRLTLHSQSEDWEKAISLSLRPKDIAESPAAEDINERRSLKESRKCQPLIKITNPESQINENSILSAFSTTGQQSYKVHHCPSKDQKLSPGTLMQGMECPIHESAQGAKSIETGNDMLSFHLQCKDLTEGVSSFIRSKDITYLPQSEKDMNVEKVEILSSAAENRNESLEHRKSQLEENARLQQISPITGVEKKSGECYLSPFCPAKDHELPPSEISQGTASPTPESMDGVEYISTNISATEDKEKSKVQDAPPNFTSKDHELPPSETTQRMASSTLKTIDGTEYISSNVIVTSDEEKSKVQGVTRKFPFKDHELQPSALSQGTDSSTPESNNGAKHMSFKVIVSGDEENHVNYVPPHCPSKDHEQSPSAVTQGAASYISESIDGTKHISTKIIGDEEKGKDLHELPPSETTQGTASSTPKITDGAEYISSNVIVASDEDKIKVYDVTTKFPSKDHELQPIALIQNTASSTPEPNNGAKWISSNIIASGDEENHDVSYVPPHCPSKDHELSPSAVTQCMVSSIAELIDKTKHISTKIIATGDEEKAKVHYVSPHCPSKDHESSPSAIMTGLNSPIFESVAEAKNLESENGRLSLHLQSEDRTEGISTSLRPKYITDLPGNNRNEGLFLEEQSRKCQPLIQITGPESPLVEHISSNISTTGNEKKAEVRFVPLQCPPNDLELLPRAILQGVASPTLQSIDGAEHTLSNINNIDKEKGKDQDVQQNFSSKENKLSPSEIMEGMGSPTLDPVDGARNLETLDTVRQPTHPVYAMSSFWNEMEKLTINDILRLRLVSQAQHPSVLLQPEDSGIADISDAADSGYFTHFDDSKPDRSSGDMSFISDFDEELSQLQTQEAAKLDEGSQESPNSGNAMWESDADPSGTGTEMEDVFMLSSETALPPPLYRDNAQQCFRKMCKNISVQNLQALEAEPFRKILRNASLLSLHSVHSTHSIHTEVEDDYVDPFDRVDASSPVCLSDEEEEMESAGITFSEIIQYLFGGDEPECCTSTTDNTAASYLDGTGTSVPETYDHFFSEFEGGSLFHPLVDNSSSSKEELVPIFSCSRSVNTNLQFPEVYDYFFSDDSHSDEDEDNQTVIQVFTRHDYIEARSHNAVAASDTYEEPPPETDNSWNFLRNNPLSFRKVRRSDFTAPPEKSSSWALTPVKNRRRSFQRGIQPINAMGPDEKPFPDPLLLSLENRIFGQLANQQNICSEMQTAVADPRIDAPLMPLKQADMCLVCIAFASWVLKSANPQGADMWKAALLANISALSAIRYLRRWTRDEAAKKAPLRQIKPA
ncbi:PGC-1 and ERR-induced regulator in muscle protein 1 [Pygocentrus nattereri]|nr:PGC-1 and ERR-induced regulator in muscle protein 1 [Pygocentrus nattereri]